MLTPIPDVADVSYRAALITLRSAVVTVTFSAALPHASRQRGIIHGPALSLVVH